MGLDKNKKNGAMKKDIRRLFYGFTMAEILISLGIAMVLATALVPVLGTKKVKHPHPKTEHGIAACYYNANNQLQYEFREIKRGGRSQSGAAEGNTCSLGLPTANYVEIIAVGAGGSSTSNDFQMAIASGSNQASGALQIDNHFQESINGTASNKQDLPDKIRTTLNEWAQRSPNQVFANFNEIISPVGAGGSGKCTAVYANPSCSALDPAGRWYAPRSGYPTDNYSTDCWWYQHGKGGSSGPGKIIRNAVFPITGNSVITMYETTEKAGVNIKTGNSEASVFLTSSGNGGDPEWHPTPEKGYYTDGANSNVAAGCTHTGSVNWCNSATSYRQNAGATAGTEQVYAQKCTDTAVPALGGTVNYRGEDLGTGWSQNAAITWVYDTVAVRPTLAQHGEYGKEVSQSFENLKGALVLAPAPSGSNAPSEVRHNGSVIVSAASGRSFGQFNPNNNYDITEQIPSEIRQIGKADNADKFGYLNKVRGSGFNINLSNCGNACPGFAGTGTYLFVKKTNAANAAFNYVRMQNWQPSVGSYQGGQSYTKYFSDGSSDYSKLDTCPDGDIQSDYPGIPWASVCKGGLKNGVGGAIIVIW